MGKSKSWLLFGYGKELQALAQYLRSHHPEISLTIFDEGRGDDLSQVSWENFSRIILSPGVDPKKVPVRHRKRLLPVLEYFFQCIGPLQRKKIIGITGTKGKTTTALFLQKVFSHYGFRVEVGGNIGDPMFRFVEKLPHLDFLILELSSFQLEGVKHAPGIGIFLNLFPEHLDRHGDVEGYFAAKSSLWKYQKELDITILSSGAKKMLDRIASQCRGKVQVSSLLPKTLYPEKLKTPELSSHHFRENLGVVWELGRVLSLAPKRYERSVKTVLRTFSLPEHRLHLVGEDERGRRFYNDSIATTPFATMAAINFFRDALGVLILGGSHEGGDFLPLVKVIKSHAPQAKILLYPSPVSERFLRLWEDLGYEKEQCQVLPTFFDALDYAFLHTPPQKVCLFSPAGKSFDLFPNYQARGEAFAAFITAKLLLG